MRYKSLVFDLDGTLIDSYLDIAGAANDYLAARGLPAIEASAFRKLIGNGMYTMLREAFEADGPALSEADYQREKAAFRDLYLQRLTRETQLFPGVLDTLERLREAGFTLSICTNKGRDAALPLIEHFDLQLPMDFIVCGDSVAAMKPDPMGLQFIMEQSGIAADQTLMVGDNQTDCLAARNASCGAALVTYGYRRHAVEELDFDLSCDRFSDLLPALGLTPLEDAA
jgi:phosphoglycolate phosphatase